MGFRAILAAFAAELSIFVTATTGGALSTTIDGFGAPPAATATPLGSYLASATMTQKYGIAESRTHFGKNQMVVTGYRAAGPAARGVQFARFASTAGSTGHTR